MLKVMPSGTSLQRQPSVGNVLARTSSFGSSTSPLLTRQLSGSMDNETLAASRQQAASSTPDGQKSNTGMPGNGVLRQGSQGSLFEQIATQAKDLVRETTRQSSQDGLLAHMDKVLISFI